MSSALIPEIYNLTDNESDEFKDIAYESFETVELNLAKAKDANKKLAIRFARRFDEIDEKTCEELLEVLENKFKEDSPHE